MNNKLYVQWSHGDIPKSYFQNGKYPSGNESEWVWENQYIPLPHYVNNTLISKHIYRREKVGINGFWTAPIPISVNEDDIKLAIKELNLGFDFNSFPLVSTINSTDKLYINNGNNSAILYSTIKQDILSSISGSNKVLTSVDITTTFNNSNNHLYTTFNPISIDYLYNNILKNLTIGGSYDIGLYSATGLSRLVYYTIIPSTNTLGIYQGDESASPEQPTIPINDFILGYTLVTDNNTTNILYTENVIYVGKGGYDTDNGNTLNTRVATFTKSLQLKALHPEYSIVCLDSSYFNEDVSIDLDSYSLEIFAPNAEFNGTWTCTGDSTMSVNIRRHYGTINITNEGTIVLNNSTILNNLTLNLSAKLKCGYSEITNLTANDNTSIYCSHIRGTFSYSDLNNLTIKGRINDIYYPAIVVDATESVKGISKLSDQTNAEDAATNATITNINDTYIITPRKLRYFWEKIKTIQLFGHKILGNGTLYIDRSKLDFVNSNGNEFTITDDSVNDKTIVNISKSGIGTKSVDETSLAGKKIPYYDNANSKFIFKSGAELLPDLNLGFVTVGNSAISGSTGTYTTIKDAIDAGKYNIKIVGGTLDTSDIIPATDNTIYIEGNLNYTNTFQNCRFADLRFTKLIARNWNLVVNYTSNPQSYYFFNKVARYNVYIYDSILDLRNSNIINPENYQRVTLYLNYTQLRVGNFNCESINSNARINLFYSSITDGGSNFGCSAENIQFSSVAIANNIIIFGTVHSFNLASGRVDWRGSYMELANIPAIYSVGGFGDFVLFAGKMKKCTITNTFNLYSGSLEDCTVNASINIKDINCEIIRGKYVGVTLTSSATKCIILGGNHTTIAVNSNNNIISNIREATSIVLGAVTGNIITGNQCDTDIAIVTGNEFANNVTY